MMYPGYREMLIKQQMAANLLDCYLDGKVSGISVNVKIGETDYRLLSAYIRFLEKRAGMNRLTTEIGSK